MLLACEIINTLIYPFMVISFFSIGGKIFRPGRCRLTDQTLEHLIFIKNNTGFCK